MNGLQLLGEGGFPSAALRREIVSLQAGTTIMSNVGE